MGMLDNSSVSIISWQYIIDNTKNWWDKIFISRSAIHSECVILPLNEVNYEAKFLQIMEFGKVTGDNMLIG
jgi:hypothetical protein